MKDDKGMECNKDRKKEAILNFIRDVFVQRPGGSEMFLRRVFH